MNEPNPILAFVVLDDGETYSRLEGCSIVITTREEMLRMDRESGDIRDLRPLYEIGLANVIPVLPHLMRED